MDNIIGLIHSDFKNKVVELEEMAKERVAIVEPEDYKVAKAAKLEALGFGNSKVIKDLEKTKEEKEKAATENKEKQALLETIRHFNFRYPHYKFITESAVKELCKKYGLVYGPVSKYTGDVPDENLQHILDFKVNEWDVLLKTKVSSGLIPKRSVRSIDAYLMAPQEYYGMILKQRQRG